MTNQKKFLFLYSELAGYMLTCMRKLAELKHVSVTIIRWPVNKEAPFQFDFPQGMVVRQKDEFKGNELKTFVRQLQPDVIYTSGWMDKDYVSICKSFKKSIPIITAFDNKWKGNLRQQLARLVSPFTIQTYFTHCFVPGPQQLEYGLKLGFPKDKILEGLYAADIDFFYKQYLSNKDSKSKNYPRRFIYVGRYYSFKGLEDLWNAFIALQEESPNDWELWCFGTGDLQPVVHPKIKHFGFVQLQEQQKYIAQTGVFVLPSRFEPWAVVAHEYAAAGFPMLLSDEVGAKSVFLKEGVNGFEFEHSNVDALKNGLSKFMSLSDAQLNQMADESAGLALHITPEKWVDTIYSVLEK